ncbi:MAG: hypothetical protein K0R10_2891 [Alphaproteobacteria bacterium]|nr:hypothetical protein [Alphaproteobacteria bacterium]
MDNATTTTAPKKKTRIAQMMLPDVDPNSALFPPDQWIKETAWAFIRDNKSFHRTTGGIAGFGIAALTTVGIGIAGAFAVTGALPVVAVAAATIGIAGFFAKKTADFVKRFKTETFPELKMDIGKKYVEYKMSELKAAFDKNRAALAAKRKAEAEAKAAAPKVETPPSEIKKVETPAVAAPVAEKKEAPTASGKGAIGNWLLKTALDQANKKKTQAPAANNNAPEADVQKPKREQPPQP